MLLAIDTATRSTSVALYAEKSVLAERTWRSSRNQTTELMPTIVEMLDQQKIEPNALTGLGVALGPGSFTGLRIGLSVAKGLAMALDIPLVGIPTLDIVAEAHVHYRLPIRAILRAGHRWLGTALYKVRGGRWRRIEEDRLVLPEQLVTLIERRTLICGEIDPELARTLREQLGDLAVIAPPCLSLRRASCLAELALKRLEADKLDDIATLSPLYLQYPTAKKQEQGRQ